MIAFKKIRFWATILTGCCALAYVVEFFQKSNIEKKERTIAAYGKLDCKGLQNKYYEDLKNNDLKFFTGGLAEPLSLEKKIEQFGVESYYQGCTVDLGLTCYNTMVASYLEKKHHVKLEPYFKRGGTPGIP